MSSPRIATSLLLRTSRSSLQRVSRYIRASHAPAIRLAPAIAVPSHFRMYSQQAPPPTKPSKIYSFQDIKSHLKTPAFTLIDTREPSELQATGTIPGSLNIPVTSKPDSFFITPEEFEDRFGFDRPSKDTEVVFYCKAGVRSRAAAELAKHAGWEKVGEYPGSWMEWEKLGGEKEGGRS